MTESGRATVEMDAAYPIANLSKIRIHTGASVQTRISVDGHPLSCVRGYTLRQAGGTLPVLELQLLGDIEVDGAAIEIPTFEGLPSDATDVAGYGEYVTELHRHLEAITKLRDAFLRQIGHYQSYP